MFSLSLRRAGVAVLGAALVLSLAARSPARAGDGSDENRRAEAGKTDLSEFLPDNTEAVMTFNVQQFLASGVAKKANLQKKAGDAHAKQLMKELNLDPFKDVSHVTVARAGASNPGNEPSLALIAQGNFDRAKLEAKIETFGPKVHKIDDARFYEITNADKLIENMANAMRLPPPAAMMLSMYLGKFRFAAVPNKNTVLLTSSKTDVEDAMKKAAGKAKTSLKSKELSTLLTKIDPKQTVSVVVLEPVIKDNLEDVDVITGGVTVDNGVKAEFHFAAKNAAAAKDVLSKIGDQVDTGKAMIELLANNGQKELAPLLDVLNKIESKAKGNVATFKMDVPPGTVHKLMKLRDESPGKN